MHWIDERLIEDRQRQNRESAIQKSAQKVFDELWEQICKDANYANAQAPGLGAFTNGSRYSRIMARPHPSGPRREVRVKLDDDKKGISISGESVFSLRFTCDEDHVVHLADTSGQLFSYEGISRKALDPLLFPELQKKP